MRAKISLFVLAFVVAVSSIVNAQSDNDSKFNFGLKLSPTIAWFKAEGTGIESDGAKVGFAYGLIADINFAKNYSFETGIDVTYRGGKTKSVYTDTLVTYEAKRNITLQYIELPITLKLKTNEIGYMTYFGRVGFAPGVNIRASNDISKKDVNAFNLSLIVGLGAQYSLGGKTAALLGLTYNNGFLDIDKNNGSKLASSFIALDLGIMF